jgi:hypothetical protein
MGHQHINPPPPLHNKQAFRMRTSRHTGIAWCSHHFPNEMEKEREERENQCTLSQ